MKDKKSTKEQFLEEIKKLRSRIVELEESESRHRESEEALQERQEELNAIFESTRDGIVYFDKTGKITRVNKYILDVGGYSKEELVGKRFQVLKMFSPKSIIKMISIFNTIKKGHDVPPCEIELRVKTGEKKIVKIRNSLLRDKDGVKGIIMTMTDITERKRAEDELKSSEEQLKIMFEYAPDAYYLSDMRGTFLDGNIKAEKIIGYKREELIGKSFLKLKLLPPKMIPKAAKLLARNIRGETTGPDEFILNHKDGMQVPVEISTYPVKIKGKMVVLGIARDITERKKAEEALLKESNFNVTLVQASPAFFVAIGADGKTIMMNESMLNTIGYSADEVKGQDYLSTFVPDREHEMLSKVFMKLTISNEETLNENHVLTKAGKELLVEWHGRPVFNEKGGFEYFFGVGIDITERKKAEEKIKASLKEKEVMLQEIHHRVKNNMQIVSSLLRLQSTKAEDKKTKEIFRECQNRIRTMALIHEKLYQSKDFSKINFAQYIDRLAVHVFHSYGVDSNIIALKTDLEEVFLDINRAIPCALIANDLLSNSVKHAFPEGKKGEICIKLYSDKKGMITLVVSDDGISFPEDIDFRKAQSLGLQMVNDLTRQIDGTIELDRNGGTSFKVEFSVSK